MTERIPKHNAEGRIAEAVRPSAFVGTVSTSHGRGGDTWDGGFHPLGVGTQAGLRLGGGIGASLRACLVLALSCDRPVVPQGSRGRRDRWRWWGAVVLPEMPIGGLGGSPSACLACV